MAKVCYACLKAPGVTRDHVPPRIFFPTPPPDNLITVKCCHECNNGKSQDDAYIWFVLASLYRRSAEGERAWEEKLPGFARCNPQVIEEIGATMRDAQITIEGVSHEVVMFQPDETRFTEYFIRLVKGLLRHHYPAYDYSESVFRVTVVNEWDERLLSLLAPLREILEYNKKGDSIFQYRRGLTDTGMSGVWLLVFYGAVIVLVHHTNLPPQF